MEPVLGVGFTWGKDDVVDFSVVDDELQVVNDSRQRYALNPGVRFPVGRLDIVVAANFEGKTSNAFDGVMLGLAWRVQEKLSVGGGYALRLGQELAPGFERDAERLVGDLLDDPAHKEDYERFRCIADEDCGGDRDRQKAYDRFPLVDPRTMKDNAFIKGPLAPSTNTSFFLGVFIPFNIAALFQ